MQCYAWYCYCDIVSVEELYKLSRALRRLYEKIKSQLKKIDYFKSERNRIFLSYQSHLQKIDGIKLPHVSPDTEPMWHLYPIRVDSKIRKGLYEHLRLNGFNVQVNYFPAHLQPAFASDAGVAQLVRASDS